MPPAFDEMAKTTAYDTYHVEPDPADFDHVLLSYHSPWKDADNGAGVLESFDGGDTWIRHEPLAWAGGANIFFLYKPELGIGNSSTWLYGTQESGYFRTTNSGETWDNVTDVNMAHGGGTLYYTKDGVLYGTGNGTLMKSTNNGESWERLPSVNASYLSIIGDGTYLYAGNQGGGSFLTAPESNDATWSNYNEQKFDEGPFNMAVDEWHGILYSANIRGGVWALLTGSPPTKP